MSATRFASAVMTMPTGGCDVDDGGAFQQWGPAWWSVIVGAVIGVVTVIRLCWDTLMTILGFRDKKAQKLAEEAHELKTEVAGIVQQMREHVITYHQTLDKRVSAVESIVGDHNKVVTELRVAIAKDMVTRDEIREVERRLIDNVNTKFELLMQQLRKD